LQNQGAGTRSPRYPPRHLFDLGLLAAQDNQKGAEVRR